jgi:predicted transcriptional regulator
MPQNLLKNGGFEADWGGGRSHRCPIFPAAEEPYEKNVENVSTPPPSSPRGKPRVQYERTYVLLPPDADAAWTRAVIQATWDRKRHTVGSSADDAGIGNLETRRVIAINPHRWPGDLRSFFETHYPGAVYVPVEAASPTELAVRLAQQAQDDAGEPPDLRGSAQKSPGYVPPREPYTRTYVLLPQIEDAVERIEWRTAAAIGSAGQMRTVGHSIDDAGVGPEAREIVAINPAAWGRDLKAWYDRRYPRADYQAIESESAWEAAVKLLPALEEDIALAQTDPRWADYDFGEEPDDPAGQETIGNYGNLLTNLTIVLRKVYRRDITPPMLDKLLVAARAAYSEDNILDWESTVSLFPVFDRSVKDEQPRSAQALKRLLRDGWEIVLRKADGSHFVYLESIQGNILHIIDPRDGERKKKTAAEYAGIRAARVGRQGILYPRAADVGAESSIGVRPRTSYARTYVLLPQIADAVERIEWRTAAAIGSSGQMWTIGHSADDAGVGPRARGIIAINPEKWNGALKAWYDAHYPGADYQAIETESPWEMALQLLPALEEDIALGQSDPRWAKYDFGAHPDDPNDGEAIGGYGCFLTGLTIILRKVYQRDATPPMLDKLLVAARAGYFNDNFMAWETAVPLFPAFDDHIKDNKARSAQELRRLLRAGWEIILRQADGGHFVYLEDVEGDTLQIIDTWDGVRKRKAAADYAGIRAAHVNLNGSTPLPHAVAIGLHDERGGGWMAAQGLEGCCLAHYVVQRRPVQIDCTHLREAGITVIARLNWGYADGTGTLPRPQDRGAFVDAVVETILAAKGVEYFHVGNEPNNRSEWPGFGGNDEFALSPGYVTEIYNEIWQRVGNRAKLGPPPLDPYFGPGSNNRDWWLHILDNIAGADALFLHAKTQTNDPNEVFSRMRFSDDPLRWQYLHLRTVETSLAVVPSRFQTLPVYVTELNPQYLRQIEGAHGWLPDNGTWVREALDYFRYERPVSGVIFYRYESAGDQKPYGLEDKPAILEAIKEEAGT